jgi:hypothetical protein
MEDGLGIRMGQHESIDTTAGCKYGEILDNLVATLSV